MALRRSSGWGPTGMGVRTVDGGIGSAGMTCTLSVARSMSLPSTPAAATLRRVSSLVVPPSATAVGASLTPVMVIVTVVRAQERRVGEEADVKEAVAQQATAREEETAAGE